MTARARLNMAFHSKRSGSGQLVHVYNSNNYLMAEYTVRTGSISAGSEWQHLRKENRWRSGYGITIRFTARPNR